MSTEQRQIRVPEIYDGTVAGSLADRTGVDPRRRRFGYHPGIYRMEIEPFHSGQQLRIIPGGTLVPFRTASLATENFKIDVPVDDYHKQVVEDFTAKWFIDNCKVNYEAQGFAELTPLTVLEDAVREENGRILFESFLKSPHGYFNQVHPSFAEIGHVCPFGLEHCATCRVFFLGGDDDLGGPPDIMQERIQQCDDPEIAERLREVLLAANVAYRDYCTQKWQVITGEYESRQKGEPGIGTFDDSLHHIRKHIHEAAPAERSAAAVAGYGNRVAEAQAEGMKDLADAFRERPDDNNSKILAALVETQRQQSEALRQQGEMLAKVGEGLSTIIKGNAPQPTPDTATDEEVE